jgi:phospholipase C
LGPLTARDAAARNVTPLLSLVSPRTDAPTVLPNPAALAGPRIAQRKPSPSETVDSGNLPGLVHFAMRRDLELSPSSDAHAILSRVQAIRTRGQAAEYIEEVRTKVRAARSGR